MVRRGKSEWKNWAETEKILMESYINQSLLYILEIIKTNLISRYLDNPLAGHLSIKKMQELVVKKYY